MEKRTGTVVARRVKRRKGEEEKGRRGEREKVRR
jgi:hypothetical protein